MTITAQEVCRHAAPVAALLGVGELRYLNAVGCGCVMNDDWSLSPDQAAALLLGLIVAKCDNLDMDPDGIGWMSVYAVGTGVDDFDTGADRLAVKFKSFCTAFARAHGLSPAPATEDPTNG